MIRSSFKTQQQTRNMVREVMEMTNAQAEAKAKAAYDRGFADGLRDLYQSRREQIN